MKYLFSLFCIALLNSVNSQVELFKNNTAEAVNSVVLFNVYNLDSLKKFEKMELGLRLSEEVENRISAFIKKQAASDRTYPLNPFVSWDMLLRAEFTHKKTGEKSWADGFYFRNFERFEALNKWKDKGTQYPFRVRFSPDKIGDWELKINVEIKGKSTQIIKDIDFKVVESDKHGFVKVHSNNRNFELDGEIIEPIGVNLPKPIIGSNVEYDYKEGMHVKMSVWKDYLRDVENYTKQSAKHNVVRVFMAESTTHIEFEEPGNYYDRLDYAYEMDNLVEICEQNNALIDFNMQMHSPIMKFADYYYFIYDFARGSSYDNFPISGYAKLLNSETPSDMFTTELGMKYQKEKNRYIISRWGYSTSIMMFELLSEPWHLNEDAELNKELQIVDKEMPYDEPEGDLERGAIGKFHSEMSEYIKMDLGHKNHLIGAVGHMPMVSSNPFPSYAENAKVQDSSWFSPYIDIVCLSSYDQAPNKHIKSKSSNNDYRFDEGENSIANSLNELTETYNKPLYFSETGHGDGLEDCTFNNNNIIDVFRKGFTGAAGMNTWSAFAYGGNNIVDQRLIWPTVNNMHNFLNSDEIKEIYTTTGWKNGRQKVEVRAENKIQDKKELKELQYLVSENDSMVIGYLYNRTFNVETMWLGEKNEQTDYSPCVVSNPIYKTAIPLTSDNGKVDLNKLKRRTRYKVDFYDYITLEFNSSVCIRTNIFGKLKLNHPTLGTDYLSNPMLIFSAKVNSECK